MRRPHFVILGAGISGLSLGWFLKERYGSSISLTILEKASRCGGWIETNRSTEGFLFEQGPRSCRCSTGLETLKLVESLGLQKEVITPSDAAKQRFLYLNQKLQPVPRHFGSFLFSPLTRDVLTALWHEWRTPKGSLPDETIYDFFSRRFNRKIAERFADPLVSGIYAGDIRNLSMKSCFPQLFQMEKENGSILKGMLRKRKKEKIESPFIQAISKHPFFSFQNGMETLVQALYDRLSEHLILGCEVNSLQFLENEIQIGTADHQLFQADHLFSSLPSHSLARIINSPVMHESIPHTSVAVVNLGWKKKVLRYEGFGHLIPSQEKEENLGVVWNSSVFPQQNIRENDTSLTVMIGGTHTKNFHAYAKKDFVKMAQRALAKQLNIEEAPDELMVKIAQQAIPQYLVGHETNLQSINEELLKMSPRMTLTGNSFYGVSVNDCIFQAQNLATNLMKQVVLR